MIREVKKKNVSVFKMILKEIFNDYKKYSYFPSGSTKTSEENFPSINIRVGYLIQIS